MKKIETEHLKKFYEVLNELNTLFPIEIETIRSAIEIKNKKSFPAKEGAILIVTSTQAIVEQCMPYIPVVSITSAPNQLSDYAGILEFKIVNNIKRSDGTTEFIAWLSVFPSGRMIFGMNGVTIDSNGKKIIIEDERAHQDHKFFNDGSLICKLRIAMITVFKSTQPNALEAQKKLITLFSQPLPKNN